MLGVLYDLPEVVTSVFVLVPRTAEENEFVTVVDKEKETGRKLPGGGASKDRAIAISAVAEIFEETGLVIHHPTQKVLEVHKARKDGEGPHHWVAMKSLPPISDDLTRRRWEDLLRVKREERAQIQARVPGDDDAGDITLPILHLEREIAALEMDLPLVLGDEIKEARWDVTKDILEAVTTRKFFVDHGKSLIWFLSGAWKRAREILETAGNNPDPDLAFDKIEGDPVVKGALDIILERGRKQRKIITYYFDEDGCLVLCYDRECEVCEHDEEPVVVEAREPEPEETMARYDTGQYFSTTSGRKPASLTSAPWTRSKTAPEEEKKISGEIEVMFVNSDRFEDWLYLMGYQAREIRLAGGYRLNPCFVSLKDAMTVSEFAASVCGIEAGRHVVIPKSGRTVVLIESKTPPILEGFVPFLLNSPPPRGTIIEVEHVKTILEAVERFNHAHRPMLWMHHDWVELVGKIKWLERIRDEERRKKNYAPSLV